MRRVYRWRPYDISNKKHQLSQEEEEMWQNCCTFYHLFLYTRVELNEDVLSSNSSIFPHQTKKKKEKDVALRMGFQILMDANPLRAPLSVQFLKRNSD